MPASSIVEIVASAQRYLQRQLSGDALVRVVDDFVAEGAAGDLSDSLRHLVDLFQDRLALYVHDEMTRREAPHVYFGDAELQVVVKEFLVKMDSLAPGVSSGS